MTDRELIRKVHNGSKEALTMIVQKYYDEIYRFCFFLTGQETDSYDIAQEVFLKFIRYADSYQYRNLKGYLLIIARNLCYDFFRHKKDVLSMEEIAETGEEDRGLKLAEEKMLLQEALMEIAPEQREVVILRIYEELSFREIAKMLGCNLSTAKSRYRLGIEKLRRLL
ncbi:MAG: RNA polymerase sigma factor [Blautia sp.]|nr:RNA polymerase sigma factor [Lachnoclostridium sp.]MCM1211936.1 RNA polymerase sigma factor [Blautia sp.]